MAKRMTEAAQLYWKDIDVLEEARGELVDYLEEVWEQAWGKILTHWEDGETTSDLKKPGSWADRQKPGFWGINTHQKQPANIDIHVRDPRRSEDPKFYTLSLVCSQPQQKKLQKISANAKDTVKTMAVSYGVEVDWVGPESHLLHKSHVEVIPSDADQTSTELAELVSKWLSMIVAINNWMLEQKIEESTSE
jgi:hypothetical protein